MFRGIGIAVVAAVAVAAALGAVFAIGVLRIHLAESGPAVSTAASAPAATRPSNAATTSIASDDPKPTIDPGDSIEAVELPAEKASLQGGLTLDKDITHDLRAKHRSSRAVGPEDPPPVPRQAIVGFKDEGQSAEWTVKLPKSGMYEVDAIYAFVGPRDRSITYTLTVADQEFRQDATASHGGRENYQVVTVGNGTFSEGEVKVRFRLAEPVKGVLLRLRAIRLIPAM